ncbi:hypothetical protein SmJEL517_g05418 [Synchytrium microbalum]|uniref:Uncharacterized protein n=1 Tax=Synchytrium microbalum TaxID=1806994 RepID=A0A507BZK0_9FUNG|nr:uncharacterized protein SmJEL517_g05418 [Synchytrium microbalum]TPX31166.1 hypothetical protein SmJEL517_g05418 [Synchytrium microbalum]
MPLHSLDDVECHHHGGNDYDQIRGNELNIVDAKDSYAPGFVISPKHLDISLDFNLPNKSLNAVVKQTFVNPHTARDLPRESLMHIVLNGIALIDLKVTGEDVTSAYDGKLIDIWWNTPFSPNESRVVTFEYSVIDPITGMSFSAPDFNYPNRPLHAVTDHETERCRYWLPCVDFPIVRTTLCFHLTTDMTHSAFANGKVADQIDENPEARRKTTHYTLDNVACPSYLICVAVGEFEFVQDEVVNGCPIAYIAPKGTPHDWIKRAFDKTPGMMKWLTKRVGHPFPFPRYYQVASDYVGGAMENITLVAWTSLALMDDTFALERGLEVDSTNIHEMTHSYFGDLLVIKHFEHAWLKESWATYIEYCWMDETVSDDEARYEMLCSADRYIAEAARYTRPIVLRTFDSSWQLFDSHTYPGGAWRIHMLRKTLGEDAFWSGVSTYVKTYAGQIVETDDFRKILERNSGLNLTKFFDQWFYSKGYPKIKATYEYNRDKKYVAIALEQTQDMKTMPLFEITITIEITDIDKVKYIGSATFTNSSRVVVVIPVGSAKPAMLRVDPDMKVLFSLDFATVGEEILGNTAVQAPDLFNRVWAYRELVKLGSFTSMKKVKDAILKEHFYGVRVKVAAALQKAKTRSANAILAAMLDEEDDGRVLHFLIKSFAMKDEVLRTALLAFLSRSTNLFYRARGAAYQYLGAQKNPDDLPLLFDAASNPDLVGMHGIIRAGALRGLGESRSKAAFDYLMSRPAAGVEPERARPAVLDAIATSAAFQSDKDERSAADLLAEYLLDENDSVRNAAYLGLISLEARDKAGDIESSLVLWPDQDKPFVIRRLRQLRESGRSGVSERVKSLVKDVEDLEAKLKKIENWVQDKDAKDKATTEASASGAAANEAKL